MLVESLVRPVVVPARMQVIGQHPLGGMVGSQLGLSGGHFGNASVVGLVDGVVDPPLRCIYRLVTSSF